ncbi:MAG: hypothetical protein JWQ47_1719 [Glaciihabitans sp.]|jgi:hypothetical protein|nr:hypothetical protein [Glaciihabitans sp.]
MGADGSGRRGGRDDGPAGVQVAGQPGYASGPSRLVATVLCTDSVSLGW